MFVFIEKLVNCVDSSEIDYQYRDTPGQILNKKINIKKQYII
jgi:hypothetical protein